MNCYYCSQHHPGGTRYGIQAAIGVCHHCGIGICAEHAHKDPQPGAPLLCEECAKLASNASEWSFTPTTVPVAHPS